MNKDYSLFVDDGTTLDELLRVSHRRLFRDVRLEVLVELGALLLVDVSLAVVVCLVENLGQLLDVFGLQEAKSFFFFADLG